MVAALAAAGLIATLAACAGNGAPEEYSTIDALKEAYVEAGGTCSDWEVGDAVGDWAQFGNCGSDGAVLSTYSSESDRDRTVSDLKSRKQSMSRAFVGPNWIIASNEEEAVGLNMNAMIVTLDGVDQ